MKVLLLVTVAFAAINCGSQGNNNPNPYTAYNNGQYGTNTYGSQICNGTYSYQGQVGTCTPNPDNCRGFTVQTITQPVQSITCQ